MSRNIYLSLAIHLGILLTTVILISIDHHNGYLVFAALLSIVGYSICGYIFLKPMRSSLLNVVSVSIVSSIGLLIGLYCWIFPSKMGFNWMIYLFYNFYVFVLTDALNFSPEPAVTFWFFVVPSLFLWIGLQLKARGSSRNS